MLGSKCRERAGRESNRRRQWESAEGRRLQRLRDIDKERGECLEGFRRSEEELKELTLEMEPLKEHKANLVAQLKQVQSYYTQLYQLNYLELSLQQHN